MKRIKFKNISFSYGNKKILNDISFELKQGDFLNIIGSNASGKTTLIKILTRLIKSENKIYYDSCLINDVSIDEFRKKIFYVANDINNVFLTNSVLEEIEYVLEELNYKDENLEQRKTEILYSFNMFDIINMNINELSDGQKQKLLCVIALISQKELIIFDESFSMMDFSQKHIIFTYLKQLKEKGTIIINITHDIEDVLISNKTLVLHLGNKILFGDNDYVFSYIDLLNSFDIPVPFIYRLNYELISNGKLQYPILDIRKLVDFLWQ
ncbi:MAG: ABC transporter ATP-binding protein [Bacilli bacterium]